MASRLKAGVACDCCGKQAEVEFAREEDVDSTSVVCGSCMFWFFYNVSQHRAKECLGERLTHNVLWQALKSLDHAGGLLIIVQPTEGVA